MNKFKSEKCFTAKSCLKILFSVAALLLSWGVFGHVFGFYVKFSFYDNFVHTLSGGLFVLIAYEIFDYLNYDDSVSPLLKTMNSLGLSCMTTVLLVITEFFCDYYIMDSNKQGYNAPLEKHMLFYKIFGHSANEELQYPIFSLDINLLCSLIGAICCAAVIYLRLGRSVEKNVSGSSVLEGKNESSEKLPVG